MAPIKHQHFLVGIETDPTRYHGESARRPAILDRVAAKQVLAHIAADLTAMFPSIVGCTLSMPGALFDQTQLIRPKLPVYTALETLQQSTNPGQEFLPRLLSIGSHEGTMPLPELEPFPDIPLGVLQTLPVLLTGPEDLVAELGEQMEQLFLEQGQLSPHSAKGLESHFHVSVNHARFMTMTDLNALLHLQLEHFGVLPLWKLLDAAMNPSTADFEVRTDKGPVFKWSEGTVHSFFESFDWWAKHGGGTDITGENQQLQSAYADWTHEYRRYQSMLAAHGVEVHQHLPGLEDAVLEDSFLVEESTTAPPANAIPVTEHSANELGTVAVTVISENRQMNFYPLEASGLNDIHQFIHQQGYSGDVAHPGRICYDTAKRQLISDILPA